MTTSLYINGIGILSAAGRGCEALKKRLDEGWVAPVQATVPGRPAIPVYPVPLASLEDKSLGRKVRRADRLSKMATLAAADALSDAAIPAATPRDRIGLIVASALGTHTTTFQFLDEILTYGDGGVSPTVFSHSVQGAPAAYIASTLDLRGPAITFTQVHFPFHHALMMAKAWLDSERCDYVLVGSVDELGAVMLHISASMLEFPDDERINPFALGTKSRAIPGEGSAFFLLARDREENTYAQLDSAGVHREFTPATVNLRLIEADGILPDETAYKTALGGQIPVAAYSPLLGSMPAASGLHAAIAALSVRDQRILPSPVLPSSNAIAAPAGPAVLDSIQITRIDCSGRAGDIRLTKP